jgi:hypothetical protein
MVASFTFAAGRRGRKGRGRRNSLHASAMAAMPSPPSVHRPFLPRNLVSPSLELAAAHLPEAHAPPLPETHTALTKFLRSSAQSSPTAISAAASVPVGTTTPVSAASRTTTSQETPPPPWPTRPSHYCRRRQSWQWRPPQTELAGIPS